MEWLLIAMMSGDGRAILAQTFETRAECIQSRDWIASNSMNIAVQCFSHTKTKILEKRVN
jgi:hypothetical protein